MAIELSSTAITKPMATVMIAQIRRFGGKPSVWAMAEGVILVGSGASACVSVLSSRLNEISTWQQTRVDQMTQQGEKRQPLDRKDIAFDRRKQSCAEPLDPIRPDA